MLIYKPPKQKKKKKLPQNKMRDNRIGKIARWLIIDHLVFLLQSYYQEYGYN